MLSAGKSLHRVGRLLFIPLVEQVLHWEDPHLGDRMMTVMVVRCPTSPLPLSTMVTTPAILGCLGTPLEEDQCLRDEPWRESSFLLDIAIGSTKKKHNAINKNNYQDIFSNNNDNINHFFWCDTPPLTAVTPQYCLDHNLEYNFTMNPLMIDNMVQNWTFNTHNIHASFDKLWWDPSSFVSVSWMSCIPNSYHISNDQKKRM